MAVLLQFPLEGLSDEEIQIQEWELVMSGSFGSNEHRRLKDEMCRRASTLDRRAQSVH